MKLLFALIGVFAVAAVLFTHAAVLAANLSDLSNIKINVTTETQVRDLLGEPKMLITLKNSVGPGGSL